MQTNVRNICRTKPHHSRDIARFFKITGYIFLIPASLGALGALISLFFSLWGGFINLIIIAFGLLLLLGYIAHCNQKLKQNTVFWLWIGTIIYNGIPLIFTLNLIVSFVLIKPEYSSPKSDIPLVFIILLCLCLFWLSAFILAIVALSWTIKASKNDF